MIAACYNRGLLGTVKDDNRNLVDAGLGSVGGANLADVSR